MVVVVVVGGLEPTLHRVGRRRGRTRDARVVTRTEPAAATSTEAATARRGPAQVERGEAALVGRGARPVGRSGREHAAVDLVEQVPLALAQCAPVLRVHTSKLVYTTCFVLSAPNN